MFSIGSLLCPCLSVPDQVALGLTRRGYRNTDLFYKKVPSFLIRKMALNVDQFMDLPDDICAKLTHLIVGSLQLMPFGFAEKLQKMDKLVHFEIYCSGFYEPHLKIPLKIETCIYRTTNFGRLVDANKCENLRVLDLQFKNHVEFQMPPNLLELRLPHVPQKIQTFPESLQRLTFDSDYDFPVDSLPPGLTFWDCGFEWNHPLPPLPETLETLNLSFEFVGSLDLLPCNIQTLGLYNTTSFVEFMKVLQTRYFTKLQKLRLDNSSLDADMCKAEKGCAQLLSKNTPNVTELHLTSFACDTLEILKLPLSNLCVFNLMLSRSVSFSHLSNLKKLHIQILVLTANATIHLPESLRVCNIEGPDDGSDRLITIETPPGLRSLSLWAIEPIFKICKLGERLEILDIHGDAIVDPMTWLPPSMRICRLHKLPEIKDLPDLDFLQIGDAVPSVNKCYKKVPDWGKLK